MHTTISNEAKSELLRVLRERYLQASKHEKSQVLDEFIALVGCHRKQAIRVLSGRTVSTLPGPSADRRTYGEAVREALIVVWEAADRICGKRLQVILPSLVEALQKHGHLALEPIVRQQLLSARAATLDRLLGKVRGEASGRRKRRKPTKPSQQVPVRTVADWQEPLPGLLEIDFVAHGGSSMQGSFLWSLVATDVCSGWTEAIPLLARDQSLVVEGLQLLCQRASSHVAASDQGMASADGPGTDLSRLVSATSGN